MLRCAVLFFIVVAIGGCANVSRTALSTTNGARPLLRDSAVALTCPPGGNGPVLRNLSVPFADRAYLLATGQLCIPPPIQATAESARAAAFQRF